MNQEWHPHQSSLFYGIKWRHFVREFQTNLSIKGIDGEIKGLNVSISAQTKKRH